MGLYLLFYDGNLFCCLQLHHLFPSAPPLAFSFLHNKTFKARSLFLYVDWLCPISSTGNILTLISFFLFLISSYSHF